MFVSTQAEGAADDSTDAADDSKPSSEDAKVKTEMKPDLIVKVSGLGEGVTRELVKEYLSTLGATPAWVEYSQGEESALVRLHEESPLVASKLAEAAADKKAPLSSEVATVPTVSALAGDEEKAYWEEWAAKIAARGSQSKGGRGGLRTNTHTHRTRVLSMRRLKRSVQSFPLDSLLTVHCYVLVSVAVCLLLFS